MINIKQLKESLLKVQEEHSGVLTCIFLANGESHILISTKQRISEQSILSTLLNDGLYIIRLHMSKEEDKHPLQMALETQNETFFLFSIENHFILGVGVRKDKVSPGRALAKSILDGLTLQLREVINWIETEAQ